MNFSIFCVYISYLFFDFVSCDFKFKNFILSKKSQKSAIFLRKKLKKRQFFAIFVKIIDF